MKVTYLYIFFFHETSQPFSHYPSKILTLKIPVDILLTWQNNPHLICMDKATRANRLLQSQLKVRATFNVSSSGKSLKLLSLNLICWPVISSKFYVFSSWKIFKLFFFQLISISFHWNFAFFRSENLKRIFLVLRKKQKILSNFCPYSL